MNKPAPTFRAYSTTRIDEAAGKIMETLYAQKGAQVYSCGERVRSMADCGEKLAWAPVDCLPAEAEFIGNYRLPL